MPSPEDLKGKVLVRGLLGSDALKAEGQTEAALVCQRQVLRLQALAGEREAQREAELLELASEVAALPALPDGRQLALSSGGLAECDTGGVLWSCAPVLCRSAPSRTAATPRPLSWPIRSWCCSLAMRAVAASPGPYDSLSGCCTIAAISSCCCSQLAALPPDFNDAVDVALDPWCTPGFGIRSLGRPRARNFSDFLGSPSISIGFP